MTSKQLALPERLPQRGSSAPLGAIGLKIQAEYLELTVEAVEGLARATADLSGPQDVLDRIIETHEGNVWSLTWPKDGKGHGGGGVFIQSGGYQSVHMSGGFHGRMTVNGVDITDMVNAARGEPLRARFQVPAKSALMAKVDAGDIRTSGLLTGVRANSVSADVTCDGPVNPAPGHHDLRRHHGRAGHRPGYRAEHLGRCDPGRCSRRGPGPDRQRRH